VRLIEDTNLAKPFLRWAGGKKWLKNDINKIINGLNFNNYHEPFIGGGFMLFHLNPTKAFVSDYNLELISTYIALKENALEVIKNLKELGRGKDEYYRIRNIYFEDNFSKAARFIYLNQMSFNGIYRVNSQGAYNVPYGSRDKFNFDYENLLHVGKFLNSITIEHSDFEESYKNIKPGDLVFLDPPYTIAHNLNGFVQYNQKIFSLEDQYRLSHLIDKIKEKDAYYILTNAAHSKVKEIFSKEDKIYELQRASVVGGRNSSRGIYSEYLFTNI